MSCYRGVVKNGHVMMIDPLDLPEGVEVAVSPLLPATPSDNGQDAAERPREQLKDTAGDDAYDEDSRPIWEIFAEMAKEIPEDELNKLPTDLSVNLDHYLYGFPKR